MILLISLFLFCLFFVFPFKILAVCPVCTVVVGASVGLCRFLGIDDTISGVWIGGLILSSGLWLADFLRKKNIKTRHLDVWSTVLIFLFVLLPLYWARIIGVSGNALFGVDKLLLGIIIGSAFFILGVLTDKKLRQKNGGKVYIYYQKVIIPIFYLSVASFIFYKITC